MSITQTLRVMKLTAILLTVFAVHVMAGTEAQTISFSGQKVPLKEVFAAVKKQTGYYVVYNNAEVQATKPVTVSAIREPLQQFLTMVLKDQGLDYTITKNTILISPKEKNAVPITQELNPVLTLLPDSLLTVQGKVVDASGQPLAGAAVSIKREKVSVVSDAQGLFTINANDGDVLTVSYVGYLGISFKIIKPATGKMSAVVVSFDTQPGSAEGDDKNAENTNSTLNLSGSSLTIKLAQRIAALKDIIVTAYGIEKSQKEIGYSAVKVSGEEINRANSGNLLTGLTGKVSGLDISTQSADMNPQMRVLLRGIRSFGLSSNNQPLFILNGTPLSFGSDNASASLVLDFINNINPNDIEDVTVLKGANATALYGPEGVNGVIIIVTKKGQRGKPLISFRNSLSYQRIDYRNADSRQRSFGTGLGTVDAQGNGIYSPQDRNGWGPAYDGSLVKIGRPDENGQYQMVTYSDKKDARRFFNVSATVQNNLSISQSDAISDFYLGINNVKLEGFVPGDSRNAINVLFSAGRKFGKINVQMNLNYSRTVTDVGPEFDYINSYPTFIPLASYKDYINNKWADNNHFWDDASAINPYQLAKANRTNGTSNALVGGLIITAKLLPWLTVTEKPGIVYNGAYEKSTSEPVYFSDFAKLYGGFGRSRDQLAFLQEKTKTLSTLNNDLLITALNKTGYFSFRTTLGNTIRENFNKEVSASGNPIVPVYNLAFSRDPASAGEKSLLSRSYSVFGTTGIGYKDRAFLELVVRNDWDSKRASVARGKDFYAGANTSLIMEEIIPALKEIKWLSRMQLRAAVNGTANMNIEPYQWERTLSLAYGNSFPYPGQFLDDGVLSYQFINEVPNPYLRPEKILTQEYGVAVGLWKDRVVADFSFYTQRNDGVIMKVKTPWLSGASTLDNLGVLRNTGWELDLKFNPIFKTGNGLTLTADVRMAMNTNKVLSISQIYEGVFPLKTPFFGTMYGIVARTGNTAFEYLVYDWKRDDQGRVIVDKNTGMRMQM